MLAGGVTSTVVMLALLLAGAATAGIGPISLLACAAGLLAAGAAGLFAAARRARALARWLGRRPRRSRTIAGLAAAAAGLSCRRAEPGWAAGVVACTGTGLLADTGVLAACFGLAGLPVPWRGLLFAYAAGQLAGRLVPLPGGIGGVEGGMLGALTLTGTPPAAAAAAVIVYRVAGYWAVGAAGTAVASLPRSPLPGRPGPGPGRIPAPGGRAAAGRNISRPATTGPAAPWCPCRHGRFHPQSRGGNMKLTIIAATGGVGRKLLEQAVAAGHDVTAVSRGRRAVPPAMKITAAGPACGRRSWRP